MSRVAAAFLLRLHLFPTMCCPAVTSTSYRDSSKYHHTKNIVIKLRYLEIPTVVPLLYSLLCWACEHETFLYDNVNKFQEKKSRQFLGTNSSRDPFEGKVLVVVRGETSNIHRLFSESKHTVNSYVQDRTEFLGVCKNVFITRKILEQYQRWRFIQYRIIRVCLLSEDIIL